MEEAQNRLKDMLQDTEIGYTKDFVVKWSLRSQTRVDTGLLKQNFPDVYEQCQKKIEFRAMTVKGGV
jgi:predicted phage-related endonuclease